MKNNKRARAKVIRRRKYANQIAYSKQFTTKNCTINKSDVKVEINPDTGNGLWKKQRHVQPKSLHKRYTIVKDDVKITYHSNYPDYTAYQKRLWKNLGKAAKMEAYVQDKLKKWEMKHPKPCTSDDMFKDEFIPQWENEREHALEQIRNFVVSMFDKLELSGRYKVSESKFEEKPFGTIKDKNGEGHEINNLKPEKSSLLKVAQKATNKEKKKNPNLVVARLSDHKRKKGRLILPKAA